MTAGGRDNFIAEYVHAHNLRQNLGLIDFLGNHWEKYSKEIPKLRKDLVEALQGVALGHLALDENSDELEALMHMWDQEGRAHAESKRKCPVLISSSSVQGTD